MTISKLHLLKPIAAVLCLAFASGCAVDPKTGKPSFKETFNSDDPCSNNARNIGIGVGAILGAVVGNKVGQSTKAKVIGAGLGAAVGGLIGHDMDKRRCELAKIAKQYNVDIQIATVNISGDVVDDATLKSIPNAAEVKNNAVGSVVAVSEQSLTGGHFESNSDVLTPKAKQYFAAIADTYKASSAADQITDPKAKADYLAQSTNRKLFLVGHTDDTGSSSLNADLSERRAKVVSQFMVERGIPKTSVYFQGAGEYYPVASNSTEEGRAKNRRVEIIEVNDIASFDKYLEARKPRYDYYRTTEANNNATTPSGNNLNSGDKLSANKYATTRLNPSNQASTIAIAKSAENKKSTDYTKKSPAPTEDKNVINFGGTPMSDNYLVADIGDVGVHKSFFSLISTAYADEPPVIANCTQDRPRSVKGVKALADGKTYRTSEFIPGLYGKTWTDQVNGHQIVMNKVAVLSNDGSLANPPEFKVYANYDAAKSRTAVPDLSLKPEVNTYLGSKGVLYRMFINGQNGVRCVDVVFAADSNRTAKAGKVIYTNNDKLYQADFKPKMY